MLRAATPLPIDAPIPVLSSLSLVEPGVFGVFRPVLLLPCGITSHLTAEQLQAILAHELCHVRRRDNLAAALHMLVQSAFWFHPLVCWIGTRLVEERERACDEDVIRAGNQPLAYAEGILNVCKFYVQSPLPCASGVTGADLRKRVTAILTNRAAHKLSAARKVVLAAAALVVVAIPVMIGVVRAQAPAPADTPKFDVAVIKPANPDAQNSRLNRGAGGSLQVENVDLKHLMSFVYDVRDFQITGGPGWVGSARWDISMTAVGSRRSENHGDAERRTDMEMMRLRIRSLLEERFQLVVHRDTKDLPGVCPGARRDRSSRRQEASSAPAHEYEPRPDQSTEGDDANDNERSLAAARPARAGRNRTPGYLRLHTRVDARFLRRRNSRGCLDLHGDSRTAWIEARIEEGAGGRGRHRQG